MADTLVKRLNANEDAWRALTDEDRATLNVWLIRNGVVEGMAPPWWDCVELLGDGRVAVDFLADEQGNIAQTIDDIYIAPKATEAAHVRREFDVTEPVPAVWPTG